MKELLIVIVFVSKKYDGNDAWDSIASEYGNEYTISRWRTYEDDCDETVVYKNLVWGEEKVYGVFTYFLTKK